jgi:YesN/AraC family two-component response regulator
MARGVRNSDKLSGDVIKKIIKLRAEGMGLQELADRFGVRKTYIGQICRRGTNGRGIKKAEAL